jgi:amidohydrolase
VMEIWQEINELSEELAGEVTRLRRDFHQHPELSYQEERTARVVAAYLRNLGLEVESGIAGYGVTGTLKGARPGRVVAFRADMDALPIGETVGVPWRSQVEGVMHACGHDFHLSLALGAARLLAQIKDRLSGTYRFIFQPAEEGPPRGDLTGARGMVAAGVLKNPQVDAILGLHVAPTLDVGHIRYGRDVVMAGSDHLVLTVIGKSAHGATPHQGLDATPHLLFQGTEDGGDEPCLVLGQKAGSTPPAPRWQSRLAADFLPGLKEQRFFGPRKRRSG